MEEDKRKPGPYLNPQIPCSLRAGQALKDDVVQTPILQMDKMRPREGKIQDWRLKEIQAKPEFWKDRAPQELGIWWEGGRQSDGGGTCPNSLCRAISLSSSVSSFSKLELLPAY